METTMIQTTELETTQTTDPRETKLKDIIEKGKASLHKTLEEIQHEFAIREDMAVRPTAIDFLVQDHKIRIMKRSISISYAMLHALCAVLFSGDRVANMEAAQKDFGDHERSFQNRG